MSQYEVTKEQAAYIDSVMSAATTPFEVPDAERLAIVKILADRYVNKFAPLVENATEVSQPFTEAMHIYRTLNGIGHESVGSSSE